MKQLNVVTALVLGIVLSGCAAVETPGQRAVFDVPARTFLAQDSEQPDAGVPVSSIRVVDIDVSVPRTLEVSEENRYYPSGDIVWRGEPAGDRYQQIEEIFQEGFARGVSELGGSVPAVLNIEVERFHSVTEKARYTVGGVHSIRFVMTLRDAETGSLLRAPEEIQANLRAFGGQRALEADRQGQTQRVRIVAHLSEVIQAELGRPAETATAALAQ